MWRFFRDTVSVEEMKTAFLKYKNVPLHKSPYAGFDTILTSKGKAIILSNHPKYADLCLPFKLSNFASKKQCSI